MRGLAVLRRLQRLRRDAQLRLIAPARLAPYAAWAGIDLISPPESARLLGDLGRWIDSELLGAGRRPGFDLLLVDVFPCGVVGELMPRLAALAPERWLVARGVRAGFYLRPDVRATIGERYQRIIWCEPPPPELALLARETSSASGPVLLLELAECLERGAARASLGVPAEVDLTLALGTGDARHQDDLLRLLVKITGRRAPGRGGHLLWFASDLAAPAGVDVQPGVRVAPMIPAMRYLAAADVVIAAAGYHAVHEARALGVPALFVPQRRAFDDQFARAGGAAVASPGELSSALRAAYAARQPRPPSPPAGHRDGALEIAADVAAALAAVD